jgi:hypothetical protein
MNRRVHIEFRGIADTIIRKGDRLAYQDSGRIRPFRLNIDKFDKYAGMAIESAEPGEMVRYI